MSELPVVTFFQRIEKIRGGVHFTVVFDLLIAARLDFGTVLERENVSSVLEIFLFDQNALERFRIEAKRRAALESLFKGIEVNVLETFVLVIGGDVRRLRDGRIHPELRGSLNIDVFFRSDI